MGQNVNISNNVIIGDGVKIQNNVAIYEGMEVRDNVFLGPSCVFTNDLTPRVQYPKGHNNYKKMEFKDLKEQYLRNQKEIDEAIKDVLT